MRRISPLLFISTVALATLVQCPVRAAEDPPDRPRPGYPNALDETYVVTLSLREESEATDFSMTVASSDIFGMRHGDAMIALTGRVVGLTGGGGIIEFELEFEQVLEGEGGRSKRRGSSWNGSAHFEPGQTIEIATFSGGSFALRLDVLD